MITLPLLEIFLLRKYGFSAFCCEINRDPRIGASLNFTVGPQQQISCCTNFRLWKSHTSVYISPLEKSIRLSHIRQDPLIDNGKGKRSITSTTASHHWLRRVGQYLSTRRRDLFMVRSGSVLPCPNWRDISVQVPSAGKVGLRVCFYRLALSRS